MCLDKDAGGVSRRVGDCGVTVEDAGGESAVEQQREGGRETFGVTGSSRDGEFAHPGAHGLLVRERAGVHVRAGFCLGGGVDERAAVEALDATRRGERVEQADQPRARVGPGGVGGRFELAAPDSSTSSR